MDNNDNKKIITLNTLASYNAFKQDLLISGENIKTINGSSILGSGNLEIIGEEELDYATDEDIENLFSGENSSI